ncbi:MAG: hypothetical protein ABIQ16_00570 [Polyangiaceae bacterium]
MRLGLFGCAGSHQLLNEVRGPRPEIREVHFDGMRRFRPKGLLGYLHVGEHSWLPFTREYQYDEAGAARWGISHPNAVRRLQNLSVCELVL